MAEDIFLGLPSVQNLLEPAVSATARMQSGCMGAVSEETILSEIAESKDVCLLQY